MASKQALDGKWTMWVTSDSETPGNANAIFFNADRTYEFKFPQLPDAKLYLLK